MADAENIEFRPMTLDDLSEVMLIERESFPTPWSEEIFRNDLLENLNSQYLVGTLDDDVITYAGIWILNEVGHITTIAVKNDYRGQGLGEETLTVVMELGAKLGVRKFTLEVRETNVEAVRLYEKHGFKRVGVRKNYYREINEDAIVMWLGDPPYEG